MTDSLGQRLREARLARSLSVEEVAQATRIRARFLVALESGDYEALPSTAQARGFVRSYAGYLGLDPMPLLEELSQEAPRFSVSPPSTPTPKPPPVTHNLAEADGIFAEVGQKLRSQREVLGLSLEDVERHTHLRLHYLKALEAGDLQSLPSPVQGRGMLNNYASFLGLDTDKLLLRFAEGLQAGLAAKQDASPRRRSLVIRRPVNEASPVRRLLSIDLLVGGFIIIFLVGFLLWGGTRIAGIRSAAAEQTATPTAPSIADVLIATPMLDLTASPEPTGENDLEDEALAISPDLALVDAAPPNGQQDGEDDPQGPPLPQPGEGAFQVYIMVQQRAWMRVVVDGQTAFDGRVVPGSAYPFSADETIEILTGNGAALNVYYNQIELGLLGALGEVVQRVFTAQGITTPTPTLTPTSLPTAAETPTSTNLTPLADTPTPTLNATEQPASTAAP
jgi:cytoskeleton protein RodZ